MSGSPTPEELGWVVVVGGLAMAFMAWGIGANDVANAFGPAFGARSLTIRQACIVAAVCEAAGAILMGGYVADTIRKGMMSVDLYEGDEGRVLIMMGMTSVLLAAATWLLVASKFGLPVSTTHSAVGGVVAFAVATKGYESVNWGKVGMIVASWFVSPVSSGALAYFLSKCLHHFVLKHDDSLRRAKLAAPVFVFLVMLVITLFTIYKGGKGVGLHKIPAGVAIGVSFAIALCCGIAAYPFVQWWARQVADVEEEDPTKMSMDGFACAPAPESQKQHQQPETAPEPTNEQAHNEEAQIEIKVEDKDQKVAVEAVKQVAKNGKTAATPEPHSPTERLFTGFVAIIAGFFSLAHGANDVANSVGPFGAVLAAHDGPLKQTSEIPVWVFILAGLMIVVGLATYGIHVMKTIGQDISAMTPSKAFCVNFAATIIVLIATRAGIPVSTTHATVGAVVGTGLAEGCKSSVNWKLMAKVFLSWILTLPIVGVTAVGTFSLFLPCVLDVPFS